MSWDKPDTEFMYYEGFSDLEAVNFTFKKSGNRLPHK